MAICYNGKDRKIISVRVDPEKYDKVIKQIKKVNAKIWYDKLSFGQLVDKAMEQFIKENNL